MSFLTALLGYTGARNQARNAADQKAYENALQARQLSDQERQAQNEADYNRGYLGLQERLNGIDAATGKPFAPAALPKSLSEIVPGNKGKGAPSLQDFLNHDLQVSSYYAQQPGQQNSDLAKFFLNQAQALALSGERLSTIPLNNAKTKEQFSQADLNEARASAERDLPARAREIAAGHDAASLQRAATQAAAAFQRTQYSAQARMALAQLTGAYMLTGKRMDEAARLAIADYDGRVRTYLQQTRPYSKNDVVSPDAGGAAFPSITVPSPNITITIPPLPPPPPAMTPQSNAQTNTSPPKPAANDTISKYVSSARQQLSKGATMQEIAKKLGDSVRAGYITAAQRADILHSLSPIGSALGWGKL